MRLAPIAAVEYLKAALSFASNHCRGVTVAELEWARIYRYLGKIAEWFEIDTAPNQRGRQILAGTCRESRR